MWCFNISGFTSPKNMGEYLQHQQVPCHLPDQGSTPLREMPPLYHRATLQGTQGASASCCFCSHNLPARRTLPSPGHHQSLPCWFRLQRPQHLGLQPTETPQHQLPSASGESRCTNLGPACKQPCTYLVQMEGRASQGAQTHKMEHKGLVLGSIITAMSKPGPWDPSECKPPPPQQNSKKSQHPQAELKWPLGWGWGAQVVPIRASRVMRARDCPQLAWPRARGSCTCHQTCVVRGACFPHSDMEEPCPERSSPPLPQLPPTVRGTGLKDRSWRPGIANGVQSGSGPAMTGLE